VVSDILFLLSFYHDAYGSLMLLTCTFFLTSLGGALKPTDVDQLWVHVTCAWYQPKVSFPVDETMEPAMGILSIPSEYFKKVRIFI
jgi:hypothetical protein